MRQGDEDEHRLGEDLVALVFGHELDGPAVVEPVGELDQHHAHVVVERQQDALEVLGLEALRGGFALAVLVVEHGLDLGQAVHQGGDLVAEQVADVLDGVGGVLHDVMQEGGADGLAAEADLRHDDVRHGERVEHIGLTRAPADVLVGLVGKFKGPAHRVHLRFILAAGGRDLHQRGVGLVDLAVVVGCELGETHDRFSASQSDARYVSTFWKL